MHIGHIKASFLNYHYAKMFNGKFILRFDDTNPSKEKQEYIDNILADIKRLEIVPDLQTYTSDSFQILADKCTWMIENKLAYCDDTDAEEMKRRRGEGIASDRRETSVEENLAVWNKMLAGDPETRKYCVRAKLSVDSKNK